VKLELDCRVTPTNLLGRMLAEMFVNLMQKTGGELLERIKRAVERSDRA
jgi:hypothetical protein